MTPEGAIASGAQRAGDSLVAFCLVVAVISGLLSLRISYAGPAHRVTIGSGSGYLNYPDAQATLKLQGGDTLWINPGTYSGLALGNRGAGPQPGLAVENNLVLATSAQAGLVDTKTFTPREDSPVKDAATQRVDYITKDYYDHDRPDGAAADVGAVEGDSKQAAGITQVTVREQSRRTIYHSPQTPGYTCWAGIWKMPDASVMIAFTQATGPLEGWRQHSRKKSSSDYQLPSRTFPPTT